MVTRLPITEGATPINPILVITFPGVLAYGLYGAFAKVPPTVTDRAT
jgi:hypothetical protein